MSDLREKIRRYFRNQYDKQPEDYQIDIREKFINNIYDGLKKKGIDIDESFKEDLIDYFANSFTDLKNKFTEEYVKKYGSDPPENIVNDLLDILNKHEDSELFTVKQKDLLKKVPYKLNLPVSFIVLSLIILGLIVLIFFLNDKKTEAIIRYNKNVKKI